VVDFYRHRGQLAALDGVGSLDEVYARIVAAVDGRR
jgi:adenylate kinase family enzyme